MSAAPIALPEQHTLDVYVLRDETRSLDTAKLQRWARDLNIWAATTLGAAAPHGWGLPTAVRVETPDALAQPGEFIMRLIPGPAPEGELADHGLTTDDLLAPEGHMYPAGLSDDDLTEALTHEIAEARVDRWLCFSAQSPAGAFWALEVGDAVQATAQRYGEGTLCANVCWPAWFAPPPSGDGPFDAHGACSAPFEILPTGYGQTWDGQRWVIPGAMRARVPAHRLGSLLGRLAKRNARCAALRAAS